MDRNHVAKYHRILPPVALRKESVDRNAAVSTLLELTSVALRKESVDRNKFISNVCPPVGSRSPQGERG